MTRQSDIFNAPCIVNKSTINRKKKFFKETNLAAVVQLSRVIIVSTSCALSNILL